MNWVVSESVNQVTSQDEEDNGKTHTQTTFSPSSSMSDTQKAELIEKLMQENTKLHAMLTQLKKDPNAKTAASDSQAAVVHPSEFVPGEHAVIFVCADNKEQADPSKKNAFVAVMDVNDDEWWEVIDPEKDCVMKQPELIDSDYVMVEDKQVLSALSKFVACTLKGYPESKALPPAQLKKLLDRSFSTLQEKGTVMKIYDWASFAYTSYGWVSYGWALYQDPTILKMIAKWSFSAATWIMFLL